MKRALFLFTAMAALLLCSHYSFSQTLYTYVDEEGVQVFTNVAPTSPVANLKVIGAVPVPPPAPSNSTAKTKSVAYDPIIEKYATNYRLDPTLIRSIIATESGFNPKAVSSKGARGLMQLMPETAKALGVNNSFDPEQNIQGGVKHFRSLMDSFNEDVSLSLAAYNAGENLVQRLGRIPSIKETQDYVQIVKKRYEKSKSEAPEPPPEPDRSPAVFKFIDDTGVLNFTNIPPLH